MPYDISPPLSDLLHSVWQSLVPSVLLQMALFHSFLTAELVYLYHILLFHASIDEHLGCVHVLAIVNSLSVNIVVHVSFRTMFFSGYMSTNGIAGS